ncbi:DUF1552 domain-containing protein [soil metagenome]
MRSRTIDRRSVLKALCASALTLPFAGLFAKTAQAGPTPATAKRFIVFYFPDGVPAPDGQASRFHATGSETAFTLPENLAPLAAHKNACVFTRGLSMGGTDAGSHPGGAKKLLTGVDGGGGESLDRYLARTVGGAAPFRHLYLGAMATQNNASGDKFISYPSAGTTAAPEDDPVTAFNRLFSGGAPAPGGGAKSVDPTEASIIDAALGDMNDLRARLGDVEKSKLDLHLEALRDVERRIKGLADGALPACNQSLGSIAGIDGTRLYDPAQFPDILRAQIDLTVQAMACGLTRVGVVQASEHTSELIMSRFPATPLYKPNYDMRSHQASHYGVPSDSKFEDYTKQRTWFVEQFAYLLTQLAARPEGSGTMLDNSIVLLCSEISDGNTHSHDNMPFILGGGGGGALRTGRLFDFGGRRHSDLLGSIAHAMGDPSVQTYGQGGQGLLPGLLA